MSYRVLFVALVAIFAVSRLQAAVITEWKALSPSSKVVDVEKISVGDVWSNCSKSGDPAKIVEVKLTPDPPKKGEDLTVSATVTLSEEVTGGNVKVSIKYGIIPIYSDTLDLCDLVQQAKLMCPLKPDTYTASITENIPSEIPSGHYTGNVEVTDQNGAELACIDLDIHF